ASPKLAKILVHNSPHANRFGRRTIASNIVYHNNFAWFNSQTLTGKLKNTRIGLYYAYFITKNHFIKEQLFFTSEESISNPVRSNIAQQPNFVSPRTQLLDV